MLLKHIEFPCSCDLGSSPLTALPWNSDLAEAERAPGRWWAYWVFGFLASVEALRRGGVRVGAQYKEGRQHRNDRFSWVEATFWNRSERTQGKRDRKESIKMSASATYQALLTLYL